MGVSFFLMSKIIKLYNAWFWAALFPPKCLICRKEGLYLCLKHQKIEKASKSAVNFEYVDDIYARARYFSVPVEKLIEYFKFKGLTDLSDIMAVEILKNMPDDFLDNAVLVPIPLHWTRRFWRGFNQAEVLAQALLRQKNTLKIFDNLKRKKRTRQQARLQKDGRIKNLESAFGWEGEIVPKKVIVVDDVVASGATLDSAAKTLKLAGVETVLVLVFARGGT